MVLLAQQSKAPFVFFNVMFGSSLVDPYIGELWLASQTDTLMNDVAWVQGGMDDKMSEEERNEIIMQKMEKMKQKNEWQQKKRYVQCARNLRDRIAAYDPQNPEPFVDSCRQEAATIVAGAYGALYGITIGFAVEVAAQEYLGFEKSDWEVTWHEPGRMPVAWRVA